MMMMNEWRSIVECDDQCDHLVVPGMDACS